MNKIIKKIAVNIAFLELLSSLGVANGESQLVLVNDNNKDNLIYQRYDT